MQFSRSMFIFRLAHVIRVRIRFRHQRCDICVDLHMIYNYMLRMAVLDRFRGWFYYVFYEVIKKFIEGDQSIIEDIPIRSSQNILAD